MSLTKPSETIAEIREPDRGLEQLYRRHGAWLLEFLRRRFGRDAEDLAQETYLRVARAGIDARHPRTLLARIATNLARDHARRAAVRPRLVQDEVSVLRRPQGADQIEALLLKQVILTLPPQLREVFLLSRFAGLTYEEIAQRCGVPVKTVEWRMSKALALCAARMRD